MQIKLLSNKISIGFNDVNKDHVESIEIFQNDNNSTEDFLNIKLSTIEWIPFSLACSLNPEETLLFKDFLQNLLTNDRRSTNRDKNDRRKKMVKFRAYINPLTPDFKLSLDEHSFLRVAPSKCSYNENITVANFYIETLHEGIERHISCSIFPCQIKKLSEMVDNIANSLNMPDYSNVEKIA